MKSDGTVDLSSSSKEFNTTRWSIVLSCGDSAEDKAHAALSQLCRTYWRPIFTFICRRGFSVSDAQDLTQDFFVMILKGHLLHYADPGRGRFRSLLLKSLQNFLIDANTKRKAWKRGGGVNFVSWDDWMAESPVAIIRSGESFGDIATRTALRFALGGDGGGTGVATFGRRVRETWTPARF